MEMILKNVWEPCVSNPAVQLRDGLRGDNRCCVFEHNSEHLWAATGLVGGLEVLTADVIDNELQRNKAKCSSARVWVQTSHQYNWHWLNVR